MVKKIGVPHVLAATVIGGLAGHGIASRPTVTGLSSSQTAELVSDLADDEGWRRCRYRDTLGHWTIGYGSKLPLSEAESERLGVERNPHCLTRGEARRLLIMRVSLAASSFESQWSAFTEQGRDVQIALLDATYQLGPAGLLGFRHALSALAAGHCQDAIAGFRASKWDHETPARVDRLVHAIEQDC